MNIYVTIFNAFVRTNAFQGKPEVYTNNNGLISHSLLLYFFLSTFPDTDTESNTFLWLFHYFLIAVYPILRLVDI